MEQRPTREQINYVAEYTRHVLDLCHRNNRTIAGKKPSEVPFALSVGAMELSMPVANLVLGLRAWGFQEQGDSIEGYFGGDLLAAQGVLSMRAQEILDTFGLRPAPLFGTSAARLRTEADGTWPRIAEECLGDMQYWLDRLDRIVEKLAELDSEPSPTDEGDEIESQAGGREPTWEGVPVRCFFADNEMNTAPVTVKFAEERFALSGPAISKAWKSEKLTKRMPTTRNGPPWAYLFDEVVSLTNARNAESDK